MEVDTPPTQLELFPTVHVLQLIKDAQQKHGLRHKDYNRYRSYCGRKIYRIRKALKYNNNHRCVPKHKSKFQPKKITVDVVTDPKFLEILVFEVERCWAFAAHLKQSVVDNELSRKKFHMRNRLRLALKRAEQLEQITMNHPRMDATTKLEVQAYHAFIGATLCLELKQWANAAELYKTAYKVYETLSNIVKTPELVELYSQMCREVQNTLRLCEFHSGGAKSAPISELLKLSLSTNEDLTHEFDKLIAEAASKNTGQKSISWSGSSAAITNSQVKSILDASSLLDEQIASTESFDDKIELFERFLGNVRDVIQKLNEENRKAAVENTGNTLNSIQITLSYLEYLRLKRANERYLVLIQSIKKNGETGEKKIKPQDFLRLYSQIIENCVEILGLPGASSEKAIQDVYTFKTGYYKAFKCFYTAETYQLFGQYGKAVALYERALERQQKALNELKNLKHPDVYETEENLKELAGKINAGSLTSKSSQVTEAAGEEENEPKQNVPLIQVLDKWVINELPKQKTNELNVTLLENPPNLQPMPCKPVFFDLALNKIQMPNLQKRLEELEEKATVQTPSKGKKGGSASKQPTQQGQPQQEQGLGSLVKNLFWGKS